MPAFDQPPKGPKIGPMKHYSELPADKKASLGDLDKLAKDVFEPAKLDPRVEVAEKETVKDPSGDETQPYDPEDIAEELAAMRTVLDQEAPEEPDEMEQVATPTEEDKQQFLRSILGDVAYVKEYSLFGGMLVVTMTDISPALEDRIFEQLALDQADGVIKTQADWDLMEDRYRIVTSMAKVLWMGKEAVANYNTDSLRERVKARIDSLKSSVLYRALLRVTRVFRRHLDILCEKAMTSDFWQSGGPSSQSEPSSQEQSSTEKQLVSVS